MKAKHILPTGLVMMGLLVMLSLLIVPSYARPAEDFGSNWLGEYFANDSLSGSPEFTNVDAAINFNWGTNSPNAAFLPVDGFSVRWSGFQTIPNGVYDLTVTADDGVRVIVDGVPYIDDFARTGALQTVTAQVTFSSDDSQHLVVVEYVDRGGTAAVQFQWNQVGEAGPAPTAGPTATPTSTSLPAIPPGAITATVIRASVLNARAAPSLGGPIVDKILRGQTYAVVGRDEDARWFLLQLAGKRAWAYGYYLFIDGNEFLPPITSATSVYGLPAGVTDTGVLAQSKAVMKLRLEPNTWSAQIGRVTWGGFVPVVGRVEDGTWWQVVWKGTVGWVWSAFFDIRQGSLDDVPIVTP